MTRQERCLAAIGGRSVDRPPRYIPGIACEVSSKILGRSVNTGAGSLMYAEACTWLKGESAHAEFEAKLFEDLAAVFRALDIDVYRMPWRERRKPARRLDEFAFLYGDAEGAYSIYEYNPESADFGLVKAVNPSARPYAEQARQAIAAQECAITQGALDNFQVPDEHRAICSRYGQEFFVVSNGGGISLGMDAEALMFLASEPAWAARAVMNQARQAIALGQALRRAELPKVLIAGGDLAGQNGPFYSPETLRQVMLPAIIQAMRALRELGAHYVFRSDGNLWPIADMLFREAACPGYGEVDREAGMTVGALRKKYPQLVLWGNMSSARLAWESAEWVRAQTRKIVAESGGTAYFHGPSNAIIKGTPPENVVAMFF
ncbi:MAG: hypothetical protein HYV35_07945 [Lentisphaerae bacterium]|nr:hypothetical protein [Lentisphaerota bacterium]